MKLIWMGDIFLLETLHHENYCMLLIIPWNGKMNMNFIIFCVYILNSGEKKKDFCTLTFYKTVQK